MTEMKATTMPEPEKPFTPCNLCHTPITCQSKRWCAAAPASGVPYPLQGSGATFRLVPVDAVQAQAQPSPPQTAIGQKHDWQADLLTEGRKAWREKRWSQYDRACAEILVKIVEQCLPPSIGRIFTVNDVILLRPESYDGVIPAIFGICFDGATFGYEPVPRALRVEARENPSLGDPDAGFYVLLRPDELWYRVPTDMKFVFRWHEMLGSILNGEVPPLEGDPRRFTMEYEWFKHAAESSARPLHILNGARLPEVEVPTPEDEPDGYERS